MWFKAFWDSFFCICWSCGHIRGALLQKNMIFEQMSKSIMIGAKICKTNTLNSNLQSVLSETFKNDMFLAIFIFRVSHPLWVDLKPSIKTRFQALSKIDILGFAAIVFPYSCQAYVIYNIIYIHIYTYIIYILYIYNIYIYSIYIYNIYNIY